MKSSCLLVLVAALHSAWAQTGGIQREVLTRAPVSVPNREAVVARVTLPPAASAGRHSHPGEEIVYILEGEGELLIEGQAPRQLKAGDAVVIPARQLHDARSSHGLRLVSTYLVDPDQPMVSPAK